MPCEICSSYAYDHTPGEWQCWSCGAWYYTERREQRLVTVRVLDREPRPEQITQQEQVIILRACQALHQQGYRFLIDFGWQNAEALASRLQQEP